MYNTSIAFAWTLAVIHATVLDACTALPKPLLRTLAISGKYRWRGETGGVAYRGRGWVYILFQHSEWITLRCFFV